MTADLYKAGRMSHTWIAMCIMEQRPAVVKREFALDEDMIADANGWRLAHRNVIRHVEWHVRVLRTHVDNEPFVEAARAIAVGKDAQDRSLHYFLGSRAV